MRDDTITIAGPFESPLLTRTNQRWFELSSRACSCGYLHSLRIPVDWERMLADRRFAEWAMDAALSTMKYSILRCPEAQ